MAGPGAGGRTAGVFVRRVPRRALRAAPGSMIGKTRESAVSPYALEMGALLLTAGRRIS